MNRDEHFARGNELLAKSENPEKAYVPEYRTALAAQAAAHFLASLAAPLAWPLAHREVLIEDGVIEP